MQYGRNVSQRADTAQAFTAEHLGALVEQAGLAGGLSGAAGSHDDDVVGQQLLHHLDVRVVGTDLRVVAADHGHSAAQNAGLHALDEGLVGIQHIQMAVGNGVETALNALAGITGPGGVLVVGDEDLALVTVLEVVDGLVQDGWRRGYGR